MLSFTVRMIKSLCIVIHGYRYDTSNDDKLRIAFFLVNANLFNEKQPTVFKCSFYAHCLTITIYFTAFSLSIHRRHIFSTRKSFRFPNCYYESTFLNAYDWSSIFTQQFVPVPETFDLKHFSKVLSVLWQSDLPVSKILFWEKRI